MGEITERMQKTLDRVRGLLAALPRDEPSLAALVEELHEAVTTYPAIGAKRSDAFQWLHNTYGHIGNPLEHWIEHEVPEQFTSITERLPARPFILIVEPVTEETSCMFFIVADNDDFVEVYSVGVKPGDTRRIACSLFEADRAGTDGMIFDMLTGDCKSITDDHSMALTMAIAQELLMFVSVLKSTKKATLH